MYRLVLIALLVPSLSNAAMAEDGRAEHARQPPLSRSQEAPANHCVDVEVNGERARDYSCLSRLLAPSDDAARPPAQLAGSEAIAGRPPTALGLANPEVTRQRMGNTFGKSTLPQRPSLPAPALPPLIGKP